MPRLKHLVRFQYGSALAANAREEGKYNVYGSNGVVGTHIKRNTKAPAIVVGRKGSFGKVTWADNGGFCIDTAYYIDDRYCLGDLRFSYYTMLHLRLDECSMDSAVPGLKRSDAQNREIKIPDLATQRRIADFLDSETTKIDLLIEKKKQLVALLGQRRQAIVNSAVGDPAFFPTHLTIHSSCVIRGTAAKGFGVRVQLRRVASFVSKKSTFDNDLRPYVGLEHIQSWTGKISASDDANPEGQVAHFKKGDILFGKLRPYLAKVAAPEFEGVCSTEALVIRLAKRVETRFLRYSLSAPSFIDRVNAATYGAKMPRANWETIGTESVYLPDLDKQHQIADFLDRATARIDHLKEKTMTSISRLKEYRSALITAAVKGQINVETYAKSGTSDRCFDAIQEEMNA